MARRRLAERSSPTGDAARTAFAGGGHCLGGVAPFGDAMQVSKGRCPTRQHEDLGGCRPAGPRAADAGACVRRAPPCVRASWGDGRGWVTRSLGARIAGGYAARELDSDTYRWQCILHQCLPPQSSMKRHIVTRGHSILQWSYIIGAVRDNFMYHLRIENLTPASLFQARGLMLGPSYPQLQIECCFGFSFLQQASQFASLLVLFSTSYPRISFKNPFPVVLAKFVLS